jgi:hypothetical protein
MIAKGRVVIEARGEVMVVPLRRRATKSTAQRPSECRVSGEMGEDCLLFSGNRGITRPDNEIGPFHRDLMKYPG